MEGVRKRLEQLKESLVRLGRIGVNIECGFFCYPFTVEEIQALIDATKSAEPVAAEDGEPSIEECLAAINRNKHRNDEWKVRVTSERGIHSLNEFELRAIAKEYLARERKEAE